MTSNTRLYLLILAFPFLMLGACQKSTTPNDPDLKGIESQQEPELEEFTKVEDYNAEDVLKQKGEEEKRKEKESITNDPPKESANVEKKEVKEQVKKTIKAKKKYGVIKFDSTLHRLAPMIEGDKTSLSFGFSNEGDGPLQILTAEVTCGCTTPNIPFLDILPGERGSISIDYNSVNKYGHQEPEIVITTNGKPKTVKLKVEVDILEKAKIDTLVTDTLSN